jgi:hypothetical protein
MFLIRSFTPEQLELLLHSLPDLRHLHPKLVSSDFLSPDRYTFEVVAELERDGSLNEVFFAALRHERPNRAGEIDLLVPLFITAPTAASSTSDVATPGAPVPDAVKAGDTCVAAVAPASTTAGTGRLINASEPDLDPTLRAWCREHRQPLAFAFLVPFAGVAVAYLLSTLVPVLAEHFTTARTSLFVTAAQVGQMCFCIYAWIFSGAGTARTTRRPSRSPRRIDNCSPASSPRRTAPSSSVAPWARPMTTASSKNGSRRPRPAASRCPGCSATSGCAGRSSTPG